ncbi:MULTISPECIES: hypothetical protein [unclassified Beijerinckia]|uniref:hypothetical protein n=1 Tax=unclassified Beijerinckia TaxID=2638183 RepID=UPI000898A785|nr:MULTISPECIES: hypothetical protein [unclassified Beijerinckia]MDH7796425.1 hypothetical protein [Beijerinckia sp. GAS462]SEC44543.1 hypothetical protein SAMN05443249_2707 [Beijerinckia sp. 28-YEA-48]
MASIIHPLTSIQRVAPEELLGGLRVDNAHNSRDAGQKLLSEAAKYGLAMRDYLRLAIDPSKSNEKDKYEGLNGYEAALAYLQLPLNDDFDGGIVLDLASDTFNTYPGTRALFPEVVDDLVQWKYRQDNIENVGALVASSRTINGTELITTVVDDKPGDYQGTGVIAEMANIPVRSIRTSDHSVKMYKIGGGYRTSYEFSRRARLDLLTPYANRIARELEMSKVGHATNLLINGDGVQAAAPVVNQSAFNGVNIGNSTNSQLSYKHLLKWFVARAKAGVPLDTVVGNWDAYVDWLLMFALPISDNRDRTAAENLARSGFQIGGVPILNGQVNFALSSTAANTQLIGMTKGETLEELKEAGSMIQEADRAVGNQTVSYYKTEVTGYRLVFGDTREIFNYAA